MNKEHIPVITDREELYDKCENMEQLYDKYYLPLLYVHYRKTYELQRENKELKKQLENCYCNRTDCTGRIKDSKQYDSLVQRVENQQKKFIEYLENEKDRLIRECSHHYVDSFGIYRAVNEDMYDEVDKNLSRFKEIIGVSNENNT